MLNLEAQKRNTNNDRIIDIRADGFIPAEIYGHGVENMHIKVSQKEFEKIVKEAGETKVINITINKSAYPVLIHHISYDQMGDQINVIDFYAVNMKEKTRAEASVHLVGESPAVKEQNGVLIHSLEKIEVEALPADLPSYIEIDISSIRELNQSIHVRDIVLSDKVKIITDPETVILVVTEHRVEKEEPIVSEIKDNEEKSKDVTELSEEDKDE